MILLDIIFLLFVAGFIFTRLWGVFGQNPTPKRQQRTVFLSQDDVKIKKAAPQKNAFYPGFDESAFLEGAESAFQMILKAYHKNDLAPLKTLVTPDLLKATFSHPPTIVPQEVCLISATITQKNLKNKVATIDVHFTSQQVLEGEAVTSEDTWTFRRTTTSKNPNWVLSAIQDHGA
ncbi:MAG: TIM44-like domain-containing protein [Holosporaceae bacterium]